MERRGGISQIASSEAGEEGERERGAYLGHGRQQVERA